MIPTGQAAFANARIRALKSQLLRRDARETTVRARARGRRDPAMLPAQRFQQLLGWYAMVIRAAPAGRALFLALVGLHEIENVKLLWRAASHGHAFTRWGPLWRSLGTLETVSVTKGRECTSLPAVAGALAGTPYAGIAGAMRRAHAADPVAAELGFDRWASRRLADAASALAPGDEAARALALALVRERDLDLLRRGVRAFRLPSDAIVAGLVQLPNELGAAALRRLATWTPADGPLASDWPRMWRRVAGGAIDWNGLVVAWRRARREACRRAFLDQPFCLAPAVALLLFGEEEVRALTAVAELVDDTPPALLEEIFAAGLPGA